MDDPPEHRSLRLLIAGLLLLLVWSEVTGGTLDGWSAPAETHAVARSSSARYLPGRSLLDNPDCGPAFSLLPEMASVATLTTRVSIPAAVRIPRKVVEVPFRTRAPPL